MARVRALLRYTEDSRLDRQSRDEETRSAYAVQQNLFPRLQPAAPGLDYSGICRPALGVSGDFYDFIPLDSGQVGLILADACGKGMPAALLGASLHSAIRAFVPAVGARNCGEVLARANQLLFETTAPDKYATVFYGVYDPGTHTLTYSNAGHYPPLMVAGSTCTSPGQSHGSCRHAARLAGQAADDPASAGNPVDHRQRRNP